MELKINDKYKKLIPPLTTHEFSQLETNCLEEGIRDAIITYNGYIIDGHNRYEIAQTYDLEFRVEEKHFDSENDVIQWMILNQFGRRNLSNYQRSVLALELEDLLKKKAKESKAEKVSHYRQTGEVCQNSDKPDTKKELAKIANVSHDTISKVKVIEAKAPEELKEKLNSGESSINEVYKEIKKQEKQNDLNIKKEAYKSKIEDKVNNSMSIDIYATEKKFRVIYADPPWSYNDKQETANLGGAKKHYDTMSIKDLCLLPISEISETNSVLFLWVTSPLLEECFDVIKAWGFKYKTSFVWDKVKHNMGHYNSVRHELLLVCTKGSCTPDNVKLYDSVVSIERNDIHSNKPIEFINIIDDLYQYGERIEIFCRQLKKENWYGWGNEF
jgi:N6-adenosine-specific RNA methylase IME4